MARTKLNKIVNDQDFPDIKKLMERLTGKRLYYHLIKELNLYKQKNNNNMANVIMSRLQELIIGDRQPNNYYIVEDEYSESYDGESQNYDN